MKSRVKRLTRIALACGALLMLGGCYYPYYTHPGVVYDNGYSTGGYYEGSSYGYAPGYSYPAYAGYYPSYGYGYGYPYYGYGYGWPFALSIGYYGGYGGHSHGGYYGGHGGHYGGGGHGGGGGGHHPAPH